MFPTRAVVPTLSRSCDEVWFTWPELHAERVTGAMSRTPMTAARRARFTVVDLQGEDARAPSLGTARVQRIGTPRCSARREPVQRAPRTADAGRSRREE